MAESPIDNGKSAILWQEGDPANLKQSHGCEYETPDRRPRMSEHYHDSNDLKFLKEMSKEATPEFTAWLNLDKIVGREDGAIPRKYRELLAVAVACTTQCPYCIEVHTKAAKKAGATRQELSETAFIAAALRAGGAATHGAMAMKFYDQE
jgi:AhpD family alkylhydroperoxidase